MSDGFDSLFFECNPLPMWVYDLETYQFLAVNHAAVDKYGWNESEFLSMTIRDIRPPEDVERLLKDLQQGRPPLQHSGFWRHRRRNGSVMEVEIHSHTLDFNGRQAALVVALDVTERRRAEKALLESEARYRTIVADINELICRFLPDGTLTYVNDAYCRYYGKSREELIGTSFIPAADGDFPQRLREHFRSFTPENPTRTFEQYDLHPNGEKRWREWLDRAIFDQAGQLLEFQSTGRDITARKRAEELLRESEVHFRRLAENAPDLLYRYEFSPQRGFTYVSPSATAITGYTPEEHYADSDLGFKIVHPEDRSLLEAVYQSSIDPSKPVILRWVRKDGAIVWTEQRNINIYSDAGELIAIEGIARDITARKQAEEALRLSEAKFRAVFEAANVGKSITLPTGKIFVNKAFAEMLGYNQSELVDKTWQDLTPPEDIEPIQAKLAPLLNGEEDSTRFVKRYFHKNGSYVWADVNVVLERNAEGDPLHFIVTILDITERRKTEADMRLQSAALEATANAIVITDRSGTIEWVNSAYAHLTGYTMEEAIGKNPRILKSGAQDETFYQELWDTILSGKSWHGELINKRKDGSLYHEEQIITPFTDSTSQVTHFIGIKQDITARVRAEEQVHNQLNWLNALREIDLAITSTFDLRANLSILLSQAVKLLSVDAATVLLLNTSKNTLDFEAGIGFQTDAPQTASIKMGESYAGKAAQEQMLIKIPNLSNDPDNQFLTGFFKGEGFVSYYGAPLVVKGNVIGVLEVFSRSIVERSDDWFNFYGTLTGQAAIAVDNARLFQGMQQANLELISTYDDTIEGWSRAMDMRDRETEGHTQRVTKQTLELAQFMGVPDVELPHFRRGALLHDIGKIGVPDNILFKSNALTEEEWEIMRRHPVLAREMLLPIRFLKDAAIDIPYCHHEKWDGTGYPRGLKDLEIPLSARIFAVVDVWDALTSDRPYRPAWSAEKALAYIREQTGKHFDPDVVKVFIELRSKELLR